VDIFFPSLMSGALITFRIQIGIDNAVHLAKTLPENASVDELREMIRHDQNVKVSSQDGLVLVSNGQRLRNPEITLSALGLCTDSKIICIISQKTGRNIEELCSEEEGKYDDVRVVLTLTFETRPFGFSVWANEKGENAIVTKVGDKAIASGLRLGYSVFTLGGKNMMNEKHENILHCLKNYPCPLVAEFIDLGKDYTVAFDGRPLGFTVIESADQTNAQVTRVQKKAQKKNVKFGSYIAEVNGELVFGKKHKEIVDVINRTSFPMVIGFRDLPKLLQESETNMAKSSKGSEDKNVKTKKSRSFYKLFSR